MPYELCSVLKHNINASKCIDKTIKPLFPPHCCYWCFITHFLNMNICFLIIAFGWPVVCYFVQNGWLDLGQIGNSILLIPRWVVIRGISLSTIIKKKNNGKYWLLYPGHQSQHHIWLEYEQLQLLHCTLPNVLLSYLFYQMHWLWPHSSAEASPSEIKHHMHCHFKIYIHEVRLMMSCLRGEVTNGKGSKIR